MKRLLICLIIFSGCMSDKSTGTPAPAPVPPATTHVLRWDQDPLWDDNSAMSLTEDVRCYELFVINTARLDNVDDLEPCAAVAGIYIDNAGEVVVSNSFDLNALREHGIDADNGVRFVFMKTVSVDNVDSEYSAPHVWEEIH